MPSRETRALRPSLIRLIVLLGARRLPAATTRAKPVDFGALSSHLQRDIGLGR